MVDWVTTCCERPPSRRSFAIGDCDLGLFSIEAGFALGMRRGPWLASRSGNALEIEDIDENETAEMRSPDMCLAGAVHHHRVLLSRRHRGIDGARNGRWRHGRGYVHDDGHGYRHRRGQARTHARDAEWPPGEVPSRTRGHQLRPDPS